MRFMNSDFIVTFIGVTAIVTSLTLFYFDYTKKVTGGDQEKVGTITFKRMVAQRKYGNQVVWEEIETNTPVFNFDSIRTADLSDAVIKLNDGTEISLSENSLIMLSFQKEAFDIDFQQGHVMAKRDSAGGEDLKELNIKSKDTVVTVANADLSLSSDKGKDLNITVSKGNASINSGGQQKLINANQKAIIGKDKMDLVELNLKLKTPASQKYFITSTGKSNVSFTWEEVKGDHSVNFQVSKNRNFRGYISNRGVKNTASNLNLADGSYYWRLRAVNRKTKKVSLSETRRLSVVSQRPVLLIAPRNNEIINYKKEIPSVRFKWSDSQYASNYKLTISRDQKLSDPVKSLSLKGTIISMKDLPKGTYYWRVDTETNLGNENYSSTSRINKLVIDQNVNIEPPVLMFPPDNKRLNQLVLQKKNIIFTWRKTPELKKAKFVIAKDNKFTNILHSAEGDINFNRFQKDLPVGTYFWRVSGIVQDKTKPVNSLVRKFFVTKPGKIQLFGPADNFLAIPVKGGKVPAIKFSWNRIGIKGKYNLQISNNDSFSSIFRQVKQDGLNRIIRNFDPGKYFWRVEFFDEENVKLMSSGVRSVLVLDRLGRLEALGPTEGNIVDMSDSDELMLKWRKLNGVDYFKLGLYHEKDGKVYSLVDTKITDTEFKYTDLKKLDEGTFFWTLQGMDVDNTRKNATKKIIRRTPVLKSNFTIRLENKKTEDVKKIKLPKILILE